MTLKAADSIRFEHPQSEMDRALRLGLQNKLHVIHSTVPPNTQGGEGEVRIINDGTPGLLVKINSVWRRVNFL